jgi:hypothetical protein
MSAMPHPDELREASTGSLLLVVGILIGSALAFTLATAPFAHLLGPGAGAVAAAFHGLAAFLFCSSGPSAFIWAGGS